MIEAELAIAAAIQLAPAVFIGSIALAYVVGMPCYGVFVTSRSVYQLVKSTAHRARLTMIDPQKRARHLEKMRQSRLELWRIRGQVAGQRHQARVMPKLARSMAPETVAAVTAAWLAGYDGASRGAGR